MPAKADVADQVVSGAKIGPNALTQTVRALREEVSADQVTAVLGRCNQEHLLHHPVTEMVDERAFAALVAALTEQVGVSRAQQILRRSGQLTAVYLLKHRIPRFFQALLRPLPKRVALKLLLAAISRHAWTFVGSGSFRYNVGQMSQLVVAGPIRPAEAVCGFYGGTFSHLIRVLIDDRTRVETKVLEENGEAKCVYSVRFKVEV